MKETEMVVLKMPLSSVYVRVEASKAEDISHIEGRWWASAKRLEVLKRRSSSHNSTSDEFFKDHRRKVEGSKIEQCWRYHLNSMIVSALVDRTIETGKVHERAKVQINGHLFYYIEKTGKRISFEPILWPDDEFVDVRL